MLEIKVYRCGGMRDAMLLEVESFESACRVIKEDVAELLKSGIVQERLDDFSWYLDIRSEGSHCNSFVYDRQTLWTDELHINYDLVKRLNEMMI